MKGTFVSVDRLPIAVNGLSGGAESAFLCEAVREAISLAKSPVLILVENESEVTRVTDLLRGAEISAVAYKRRDLVFYNIRASHDVDRERLSVLSLIQKGECDAVVSTPSSCAMLTLSPDTLTTLTREIKVGDILPPEELTELLVTLGFKRCDAVESRGQFSRRGG